MPPTGSTANQPATRWLFRLVATAYAALLAAQPVLAGRFLAGEFEMLAAHALVGGILVPAGIAATIAAVVQWRPGGGPGWPIAVAGAMTAATGVQIGAGYTRNLGLHVPLGVAIVAAGLFLAGWAWRPARAATPPPNSDGVLPPPRPSEMVSP